MTVLVVFYFSLKMFATSLTTTKIISCLFISLPPPFQLAFKKKSWSHFWLLPLAVAWFDVPDAFSSALLPVRFSRSLSPASREAVDIGLCHVENLAY